MKHLSEIRNMLCEELDKIGKKGELSAGSLDLVHKLTDTIKNIDKIEMLEDNGHSYGKDGRYDDNMSYRKGYSRDDAKSEMMHNLEEIMEMASTPQERNIIRGAVEKLERM